MQNPFTTTFSKIPDNSYISIDQLTEILQNFSYDQPSESVYKITGVRGSGKTVLLAKIESEMQSDTFKEMGWLVCSLSPARDMLGQFAAFLRKEGFGKTNPKSVNISANVMGIGGGVGITNSDASELYDIGIEISQMLQKVSQKKKKILIGIDEVSKTEHMIVFASEFGKWLIEGQPVYMACTGLYENIEQLSNVKNLTFFRRATTIKTEPLSLVRISEMYRKKLGLVVDDAKAMASMTKGYAYAYQELGVLYFKNNYKQIAEAEADLRTELYAYAYEKIWEELSKGDRQFLSLLMDKDEYAKEEVVEKLDKPNNYPVYRDRLLRRGILGAKRGYIGIALPYFRDYIKEYHN